jgi:MYXO-CTERM domain-containing protein
MSIVPHRCARIAALLCIAGSAASATAGLMPHQAIALTGTDGALGPGMGAGVSFAAIGQHQPSVNSAGQVAFRAVPSGAGTSQGMWVHSGVANTNVAMGGGAQPGGGTYITGTSVFNSMQLNESGQWAVRMGASTGLFGSVAGTPTRAMLTGDAAPGAGGANYASSATGMPLFNNAGQVGYIANLAVSATSTPPTVSTAGVANTGGIWVGTPGSASLVLRQNDAITALDPGGNVRVGALSNLTMSMNGSGRYVVQDTLQGTVTTGTGAGSNSVALLTNRSGSLEVLARVGNAAPDALGVPSATDVYRTFSGAQIAFNNSGATGFVATLRNGAGTQTATSALFSDASGTMRQVARNGDSLPAITGAVGSEFAGATWSSFSSPLLTASGTMLLSTSIAGTPAGTGNVLMTVSPGGTFTRLVRSSNLTTPGDIAIVGGAPLGGDAYFTSFSNTVINDLGQVAFQATLNGNGVFGGPGGNNLGLFAYDPGLGLCLIARTGDFFEVAPGDFRTVATLGGIVSSGGQDGRTQSLSANGYLAYELDFTDGSSGIFVTSIPSVGTLPLLGLVGLAAARRRR